jgi:NAD(P)-dependent dehydrogenase (short-subunit alcohol dehydrogenase family)
VNELSGQTILITGASTGIGRATAAELAARGGRVTFAGRNEAKTKAAMAEIARETGNDALEFAELDLGSIASAKACAAGLVERGEPLDILINNAGLAGQRGLTADGFELAFGTNHVGHFALTTGVLELLTAAPSARVVTLASDAHYGTREIDWEAVREPTKSRTGMAEYRVSKLANVLFSQELARRCEGTSITTYSLHPGVIASDIWRGIPWPARKLMMLRMKSTEAGAQTSIYCATALELEGQSGRYYEDCAEKQPSRGATPELAGELWERSEAWVAAA